MKDYSYFQNDQAKLFSIFSRSRSSLHFNCLALINEECKCNLGYVIKDFILNEIEKQYGEEVNPKVELSLLVDAGWIELFQRPHLISDFIRMTKNGRILYQAIQDVHGKSKDFSYGKYVSDIYRRLITVEDTSSATYQDILAASVSDTISLKEYMQNFSSSFEEFVKSQKANVEKAEDIIKIMRAVSEGKEFRNYKAIVRDEMNYYKYSNLICEQIEHIKNNESIISSLAESCHWYEDISIFEAEEKVYDDLYCIKIFFLEEYNQLVTQMKETENECYQKIANTLTLYASDGTADKSVCDLLIQAVHDAQEKGNDLSDRFYECFSVFDNTIFEASSLKAKRKIVEYKNENDKEIKSLSLSDKLKILVEAKEKLNLKTSVTELEDFLKQYEEHKVISSNNFKLESEKDYSRIFMVYINCNNPSFSYQLKTITGESIIKNGYTIPDFEIERKESYENRTV